MRWLWTVVLSAQLLSSAAFSPSALGPLALKPIARVRSSFFGAQHSARKLFGYSATPEHVARNLLISSVPKPLSTLTLRATASDTSGLRNQEGRTLEPKF